MSSLQIKKKHKTGIPVMKITPRSNDEGCETATYVQPQHPHVPLQTESSQNRRNQPQQTLLQRESQIVQQSMPHSNCNSKASKKSLGPTTWVDEVIESQSQKLRSNSLTESRRRREDMEQHLKEAEVQLVTMGNLLEQRDKMMKEAAEEAEKKTADLENRLLNQQGHLIKHSIDPVTGETIVLDEEGEKNVELSKKFTKKRVQEMREKLKQMNNQTESYLSDIQNTLQFLNNLEAASDKMGQLSDEGLRQFAETYCETDEITAQVTGVTSTVGLAESEKEVQKKALSNNLGADEGDECNGHDEDKDIDSNDK